MKILRQISLTLGSLLLSVGMAHGSAVDTCMQTISQHNDTFLDPLYSEIVGSGTELNQDIVKQNKAKILALIASNTLLYCMADMPEIADVVARAKLPFVHNNQKYAFNFSVQEMIDFIDIRTGIMVYNNRTKSYPDVIKVDDIKSIYWSDKCSDHVIWDNLDDNAAVNVAGQRVFKEYGGSDNEFFLDFEKGNNMRAFPGLVIMDETRSTHESIVSFRNITAGKQAAANFASALKNTACANQNLAVYLVALDVAPDPYSKDGWAIAAGIGGGAMALVGLGAWAATGTAVAATGSMLLVDTTLGLAAVASAVPVWGWIAAGVLVAAAGAYSLYPSQLQKIDTVMVLAGPYNI